MLSQDQINSNQAFVASLEDRPISEYWHLCDEFSVRQAALLIVGLDPASETGTWCEAWKEHERPRGYEAVKQAIGAALRKGVIKGEHVPKSDTDWNGNEVGDIEGTTEPDRSTIERNSLVSWLQGRGVRNGFFFPDSSSGAPDYLDPKNLRYAPKLAASVQAWLAVADPGAKSPKQALDKWLRENAAHFGLTDDEGKTNETAIEECAKVANWKPGGGAPKTPAG